MNLTVVVVGHNGIRHLNAATCMSARVSRIHGALALCFGGKEQRETLSKPGNKGGSEPDSRRVTMYSALLIRGHGALTVEKFPHEYSGKQVEDATHRKTRFATPERVRELCLPRFRCPFATSCSLGKDTFPWFYV